MAELGQQTVELSSLIRRAAEDSFSSLKDLIVKCKSADQWDSERKIGILKYLVKTQQRLLRLDVLTKWCNQLPLIQYCEQLQSTLSSHEACFVQAADSLFFMHEGLQQARAPVYDVPSAIEVLLTGSYQRLPKCIEEVGIQNKLAEDEQKIALKKLDVLLRSRLLDGSLPREISEVKVRDGTALLHVDGEFNVLVTLGYRGHLSMWRVLHLELLVGERHGLVKLEEFHRHALGDDIERRMAAAADNPLVILYSVLHELCVALVMDTLVKQVQMLRHGRWRDLIRFEFVSDGREEREADSVLQQTPGLRIVYWLHLDKNWRASGSGGCPFIKIEPTEPDLKIKCSHSSFLLDPSTGREMGLFLDYSRIDVEKLLLKAISCHKYTRLLDVQKELEKTAQIFCASGDVILQACADEKKIHQNRHEMKGGDMECEGQEVLHFRAYGSSFFSLGINIRNGRFVLRSSENILAPSTLLDYEEGLNLGSITAAEVFTGLRRKSILHLTACIGKFLGLKAYEDDFAARQLPKDFVNNSATLLMRFPDSGSFFLLVQLSNDFKPLFKLLQTQDDPSAKVYQILQIMNINLAQMPGQLSLVAPHLPAELERFSPSSFASIIEEVFQLEIGPSAALHARLQDHASAPNFPSSHSSAAASNLPSSKQLSPSVSSDAPKSYPFEHPSTPFVSQEGSHSVHKHESSARKRTAVEVLTLLLPSHGGCLEQGSHKRRKVPDSSVNEKVMTGFSKGHAFFNIYVATLLQVVGHCSLCIKTATLAAQMKELKIPFVEGRDPRSISPNIWFRVPFAQADSCESMCLRLGKAGSTHWDVRIHGQHFRDLWELQKGNFNTPWGPAVRLADTSELDSHICVDSEGVILSYKSVEPCSIRKLMADILRLFNAQVFSLRMRSLLGLRAGLVSEETIANPDAKVRAETSDIRLEQMRKAFRIEAVGIMGLWFGFGPGDLAHFSVEWESNRDGCTVRVSPDHVWPHTKFLEDFINGVEVASLLDCIRVTTGPLHALAAATKPTRSGSSQVPIAATPSMPRQGVHPSHAAGVHCGPNPAGSQSRSSGPSFSLNSLWPTDVSAVLCGPYWIRIIYRKCFAVDMRCHAGDQVWLQPAPPPAIPKGENSCGGGSSPCPQFRPFVMDLVAQELNGFDPALAVSLGRAANAAPGSSNLVSGSSTLPARRPSPAATSVHGRGDLGNTTFGVGDDGGYAGAWVPLLVLKKVLRAVLRFLGVLWLLNQTSDVLKDVLGSILKETEGSFLNLDPDQPALRFFIGGYVFAVTLHRAQLLLQVLSVKRVHLQQQISAGAQDELAQNEIGELCDYFSRRVVSEPYDTSRIASFITLLTLPLPVLREFLKLIAWKKGLLAQAQGGEVPHTEKPLRIELSLENRNAHENARPCQSNIRHDRAHNSVEFALTVVLEAASLPPVSVAGGAAWLPYCVSARLKYSFGESVGFSLLGLEGSHGGRACFVRADDWERCKQCVALTVEPPATGPQGSLIAVAENLLKTVSTSLQALKDNSVTESA